MLKLKSEIWTNSKGKRFVVVPEDDFARLSELIEDAGLSRIPRDAKKNDTSAFFSLVYRRIRYLQDVGWGYSPTDLPSDTDGGRVRPPYKTQSHCNFCRPLLGSIAFRRGIAVCNQAAGNYFFCLASSRIRRACISAASSAIACWSGVSGLPLIRAISAAGSKASELRCRLFN